jgi:DNA-binding MarR family transcriptional regulator
MANAPQPDRGASAETPKLMPEASITAREIAEGTGLSLSATYRALHHLEERGLIVCLPGNAGGRPRGGKPE